MKRIAPSRFLAGLLMSIWLIPFLFTTHCTRVIAGNDIGLLLISSASLFTISETGGSTAVSEDGGTDTYTIRLVRAPAADVSLTITPDGQVLVNDGSSPITLLFTPTDWDEARTVTVAASDDAVREGPHSGSIAHSVTSDDGDFASAPPGAVTVAITDDDVPSVIIAESGGSTAVAETGTTSDAYSIRLNTEPAADVSLSIAFDVNQVRVNGSSVSPVNIVFDSICPGSFCWSTPRGITVTAVDDALNETTQHASQVAHSVSSPDGDYNGVAVNGITASITDNDGDVTAPTVTLLQPTGSPVGTNTAISITFSEPMNPATIAVATAGTGCNDSLQVSRTVDNFTTNSCVQMSATPVATNGNRTFTIKPLANLNTSDAYLVRVTVSATDTAGNPLATIFTSGSGIATTAGPDATAPAQAGSNPFSPANGSADISISTSITVNMNDFMLPSTMTTNLMGDTTCSGTFQLSLDNFTSCIPMQAQPVPGADHTSWTMTPLSPLLEDQTYQVRLAGAKDAANIDQVGAINWSFQTED